MKFIYVLFSFSLMTFSCEGEKARQSYISSYMLKNNGQTSPPNFSFIEITNDSIFYRDLNDIQNIDFLGKIPRNEKNFQINELIFQFTDSQLEVSNGQIKSFYKLLNTKKGIDINASYFVGKRFVLKSEKTEDTIFFNNDHSYKNLSENHSNRWRFVDIGDYKILWMFYGLDEVPLVIDSFEDKKIITYLHALEKEKIYFEELSF